MLNFLTTKQTNRHWDLCFGYCILQAHKRWPSTIHTHPHTHTNETEPTSKKPILILFTQFKFIHLHPHSSTMHPSYSNCIQYSVFSWSIVCFASLFLSLLFHCPCLCPCPFLFIVCISVKIRKKIQTTWFTMLCNGLKQEKNWKKIGFCSIPYLHSFMQRFFLSFLLHHLRNHIFP